MPGLEGDLEEWQTRGEAEGDIDLEGLPFKAALGMNTHINSMISRGISLNNRQYLPRQQSVFDNHCYCDVSICKTSVFIDCVENNMVKNNIKYISTLTANCYDVNVFLVYNKKTCMYLRS